MFPQMLELICFTGTKDLPIVSVIPHKMNHHFHISSLTEGCWKMKTRTLSMKYQVESLVTKLLLVSEYVGDTTSVYVRINTVTSPPLDSC